VRDDDPVEVLDLGTLHDPEAPGVRQRLSRRAVLSLGGLAAVGAGLSVIAGRRSPTTPSPPPVPIPVPDGRVVVTDLRRALAGGSRGDVFGFNQQEVVRVELASGRVTRTGLGGLEHAPLDVVPIRGGVVVHRRDDGSGFVVPDGRPPAGMPRALEAVGPMLPGPDPDHVWITTGHGRGARMQLVALDGRPAGTGVPIPADLPSAPIADGGGYPLFFGVSGTYWAGPRGLRAVTHGDVVAGGPTGWLVLECDSLGCAALLVGRTGDRRPLPALVHAPARGGGVVSGALAPDGRRAALYEGAPESGLRLDLVDLPTGSVVPTDVTLASGAVLRSPRWSPDGRLVLCLDDPGRIVAVDAGTGRTRPLVPQDMLPPMEDIAVRAPIGHF
jgi:hypothetical protein